MADLPTQIIQARKRIRSFVRHTPLEYSSALSSMTNECKVHIKLESDQITGSFKVRGAFNKILKCSKEVNHKHGIITASSGNHGLACLEACREVGIPLTVFCSHSVDAAKKSRLERDGATVKLYGNDCVDAEVEARRYSQANGIPFISPYNDYDVVAGQGTIGIEILEDLPTTDVVLVAVGGGGLIGGIARYLKQMKPSIQIIGCQPKNSKVMYESIKAEKIVIEESVETLSDGTAGGLENKCVTFELCRDYVDDWILVGEEEIGRAVVFMVQNHHKIVEGAAGVALGAFINNSSKFKGKNVVIVSCGANISPNVLKSLMNKYV